MKTPEEYFAAQDLSTTPTNPGSFTAEEQAFIDKYMGVNPGSVLAAMNIPSPQTVEDPKASPPAHAQEPEQPQDKEAAALKTTDDPFRTPAIDTEDLYVQLRDMPEILMVAFYLGKQEFVVPTSAVQEVIKTPEIIRLPTAPPLVSGVINLRGRVTPLLQLRNILSVASPRESNDDFVIICKQQGMQIGLIIERIHTMYRFSQEHIDWNIESQLGVSVDLIAGIAKIEEQLLSIIHVDHIVQSILI